MTGVPDREGSSGPFGRPSPAHAPERSAPSAFMRSVTSPGPVRAAELRPPAAGLDPRRSLEAWIDAHQTLRRLLAAGRPVLFTDDAVGEREEESLRHITANLGPAVDLSGVAPFLTCKHPLDYCLLFARRAASYGLGAVTVTGGDASVPPPRCLPRSRDLRARVRETTPGLALGTWANPFRDAAEQVGFLVDDGAEADYFLTQVVSHHDMGALDRFLDEAERRSLALPGLFGVFYYRSARPATLERLARFLPVPARALTREMEEEGATPDEVCARTIRALRERGVEKVYVSNLGFRGAEVRLRAVEALL